MNEVEKQEFLFEIYRDNIIGQIQNDVYAFEQTLVNSRMHPLTPDQTFTLIGKLMYDGWTYQNQLSDGFISMYRGFHADKLLIMRRRTPPEVGYVLNVIRR